MATVAVKLGQLPGVMAKGNLARLEAVARGNRSGARYGRTEHVKATPKDMGMAKAAWKVYNTGGITGLIAYIQNSAPYIGILEMGARPHPVSLEGQWAIYEWVERHFVLVGGIGVSARDVEEGTKKRSLKAGKRRKVKAAKSSASKKFSKLGRMLADNLQSMFMTDAGINPTAANITAAIVQKIRTKGAKPKLFVKALQPRLAFVTRKEVERELEGVSKGKDNG